MLMLLQHVMQGMVGMVIYTLSLIPLTAWLAKPWEKYFVTDRNLQSELEDLEAAAAMPATECSPDLLVTDMNENKLAITVQNKNGSPTPPDSPIEYADVMVVQEQKSPRLHSILKQRSRTISESSDEVFTYSRENSVCLAGSESPISESEEGGDGEPGHRVRKKSVSFSEKVDQQMFKQNQPTTSLRNTLKNKRKNQRKAERKHQEKVDRSNRRNRNSDSISEMSSDGEGSSTHEELSSNYDDIETGAGDDAIDNKMASQEDDNKKTIIADTNGNITTPNGDCNMTRNSVINNKQKNKKNSRRKNRRNKKQGHKEDEVASDGHQPPETSSAGSQSEDGEGRGDDAHECCDNEKVVPKKKFVEIVKDDGHDSDDNGDDDSPDDGERTNDKNNKTILSWDQETKAAVNGAPCPVSFTNSVMFDLD